MILDYSIHHGILMIIACIYLVIREDTKYLF